MNNNLVAKFLFLILTILTCSCSDNARLKDLQKEVANLEKSKKAPTKDLLPIKIDLPRPITFEFDVNSEKQILNNKKSIIDPLLNYPRDSLRFVGTIKDNNQIWAYLLTPDGRVYSVKENDIIGNDSAVIIKITADTIEVNEKFVDLNNKIFEKTQDIKLRK